MKLTLGLTATRAHKTDIPPCMFQCHTAPSAGMPVSPIFSPFGILVDQREQRPWTFQGLRGGADVHHAPLIVPTTPATLDSGDYSIEDHSEGVRIERKSGPDLYATLTHGRQRFEDELDRLAAYPFSAVVVEAELSELLSRPPSKMSTRAFMGSVIALSMRFPTRWYFAPDRMHAERIAYRLLERWWKDHHKENSVKEDA
jgi:ERCC4-type nuclease